MGVAGGSYIVPHLKMELLELCGPTPAVAVGFYSFLPNQVCMLLSKLTRLLGTPVWVGMYMSYRCQPGHQHHVQAGR